MVTNDIIRVGVTGAAGRMGTQVVRRLASESGMRLCVAVDRNRVGEDAGTVAGLGPLGVHVRADLAEALEEVSCDVLVDFTRPGSAAALAIEAVRRGVRPVIGTSGLAPEEVSRLAAELEQRGIGGIWAPNFALGAVLMMRFAAEASRYFSNAEIVELHHQKKLDSPSGTALRTADLIAASRAGTPTDIAEERAMEGSRGTYREGIRIHSVRLPGLLAHQEVIFGGEGEVLTIRHDSTDRSCFMPGVVHAIRKVFEVEGLVVGLEAVL